MTAFRKKFARKKISGNLRCRYCLDPYELCGMIHWGRWWVLKLRYDGYLSICRLSIDGNYRTTFQPSVERYSAHTRSASRPIAGRLSFAKLFKLVDRWSIPCRYVGRHSTETLTVTLHSTVGAYRSSVAELCIIVLSVVSYLISNWAISIPMLFSHNFKTNSSNVFEWVSLDSSCHIYWFSECVTWAQEPNTKFLSSFVDSGKWED